MLPRQARLTRGTDFARARSQGRSWANRLLVVCKVPNHLSQSRLGFSISRRVGNAVVRNRVKRRLSEIVRLQYDLIESGWDIVIIARNPVASASFSETEEALCDLARWADLYAGLGQTDDREETT